MAHYDLTKDNRSTTNMPLDFLLEEDKHPPIVNRLEQARIDAISKAVADVDMKIVWDEATQTIKIGKATFDKYANFKSCGAFAEYLLYKNDITEFSRHPKWFNKATSTLVKGSMKQTYSFFKALQYKMYVVPNKHLIGKISFVPGKINVNALENIRANKDILQQVYDDKLYNLLPIVAVTGKSPQLLKKEFGPAWRVIANTSLNKNKILVKAIVGSLWDRKRSSLVSSLAAALPLPTTVLDKFKGSSLEFCQHVAHNYKGQWAAKYVKGKSPDWSSIECTVTDTKEMSVQLDTKFDPLWTPRKMKEKHDEYARRVNALKYSPEPIPWLENILPRFEHEGCVATLLNNRAAIANEGSEMGHCVGSYAESVASKSYLVYSVVSATGERSTLGIRVAKDLALGEKTYYRYSQHYRRFNRSLEEDAEKEISTLLINELNKQENVQ